MKYGRLDFLRGATACNEQNMKRVQSAHVSYFIHFTCLYKYINHVHYKIFMYLNMLPGILEQQTVILSASVFKLHNSIKRQDNQT